MYIVLCIKLPQCILYSVVLGGDSDEGMPSSDSESSSPNEMLYQKRRPISAYAYVAPHFNQQYYSRGYNS